VSILYFASSRAGPPLTFYYYERGPARTHADSNNKNIDWLLFFELIDYPDERHSVLITQRDLFLSPGRIARPHDKIEINYLQNGDPSHVG
jgi:hypothetical protein